MIRDTFYAGSILAWVESQGGLEAVKKRLMPEDMEWPKYTDGSLVEIGDEIVGSDYGERFRVYTVTFHVNGFTLREKSGMSHWYESDDRFERPALKVYDADGVEIRVGDTVYLLPGDWCDEFPCLGYHGGEELEVFSLHADHVVGGIGCRDTRRPKGTCRPQPSQLTHERPESWERLEDDATMPAATYCERMGIEVEEGYSFVEPMARDLVRRAKALAERDR